MTLTARPATLADAPLLLAWRNDSATVAASRVQAAVTAHDHVGWLERTLADQARRLMIVEWNAPAHQVHTAPFHDDPVPWCPTCVEREAVGTYRLDGVGGYRVEVSLIVAPVHRGRGLARQIIELACRHAVREGADVITAEIRRENIPSFVAFFRNGFMITGWRDEPTVVEPDGRVVRGGLLQLEVEAAEIIRRACPLCLNRTPHHTNATGSIGGAEGRHSRYDLHVGEGGGLRECEAGDLWLVWERARCCRNQK